MIDKIEEFKGNNNIAYKVNNLSITYDELYNTAAHYSEFLKRQGNEPVIIYGHKSISMIISIVACLLAKRCYIPIENSMPIKRIKEIVDISRASLFIENEEIDIDFNTCKLEELIKYQHLDIKKNNNKYAYIIFTSGTTGDAKGVPITYKNLNNFINWINNTYPFNSFKDIIVLNQASFSFDLSVMDLYYSLFHQFSLYSITRSNQRDGSMYETIKDINLMVVTPSFMKLCLLNKEFNSKNYPNLKCIYFCGELLRVELVKKIKSRFKDIVIFNAYGPTEATCAISGLVIEDSMLDKELLPVGTKDNLACNVDIINKEIVLSGDSVFNGYLDNIIGGYYKKNGTNYYKTGDIGYFKGNYLYCNGRRDNQVKYNGYRIELSDIENNLLKIDGVIDACVIAKRKDNEIKLIKAFVVLAKNDIDYVKEELYNLIPHYMMPKVIEQLEKMPLNKNGKLDKERLNEL